VIVQFTYQMSGGRYDDRAFPPPWVDFEVPDEEGEGLVHCGAAVRVIPPASAVKADWVEYAVSKGADQAEAEAETKAQLQAEAKAPEPVAPKSAAVAELAQPAPGDPKAAWVDYAVSRGATRAEAEDQTKAQLQAAYGGRL
jgi:hypothetical protein